MSLSVPVCSACNRAVFPARLLCPDCGGASWGNAPVDGGVLEGYTERDGIGVGTVRTALGPLVVARVDGKGELGMTVTLSQDGYVPVAHV